MNDAMQIGSGGVPGFEAEFRTRLAAMSAPLVLELGTLRWEADFPTHHREWASPEARYIMSDISPGTDVDLVVDAHELDKHLEPESFDAVIAVSVWEHLRRPWVAAEQVTKILKPGGIVFVLTHHTFPLHGYPSDYYRFSDKALADLFGPDHYYETWAGYQYRAQIVPPPEVTRWNPDASGWLNVGVFARKAV